MNEDIKKYEKQKLEKLEKNNSEENQRLNDEFIINSSKEDEISGLKIASQGWLVAGFIFAFLGGFLGIAIGFNYAFGNYKKETKTIGWVMSIIGILMIIIYSA
tara:strand:- start:1109 stop:1417 length:309 start_codon:yes stop_codon:yes gene_type:complete